ncbi:unnamed protein product [Durusdinium trenchii]|uniref:Uncharacterized protein n=3 Tax=Durusdinium trenchii TaxID=1381693 RepID=A0ABP0III7_9DINO
MGSATVTDRSSFMGSGAMSRSSAADAPAPRAAPVVFPAAAARSLTPDSEEDGLTGRFGGRSAIRSAVADPDWRKKLVPTEYERRSCAGMGPRIRAMEIAEARRDPKVVLGDELSGAAGANDAARVRSLLERGADPNHVHFTVCSDVPLCRTKSPEVARLLVEHPQIDVNIKDINDYSILSNMVLHNRANVELVSVLLAHKDLDVHAGRPIKIAARFGTCDMLRTLLEHPKLDINDACGLLHYAVCRTDSASVETVKWLLDHGVDPNLRQDDNGSTALMWVGGWDSLTIEIGEKEAVKRRQIAARQVEILSTLLARSDLDVNATDAQKRTALHRMSVAGRVDLVEVLLQDPRVLPSIWHQDSDGKTPLDAAVEAFEKEKEKKKWEVPAYLSKFEEVIALLKSFAEKKRAELEKLVPGELSKHPGTWSMAVQSL